MRAAVREILAQDEADGDALAVWAEASFYMGEQEQAQAAVRQVLAAQPRNLRALLVEAGFLARDFIWDEEVERLQSLLKIAAALPEEQKDGFVRRTCQKAEGWLADACYLLGKPAEAAEALFAASELAADKVVKAELYSKGLFMSNYRPLPMLKLLELHKRYDEFWRDVPRCSSTVQTAQGVSGTGAVHRSRRTIRIGYISPDFRMHAAAYFFAPLMRAYDKRQFEVYCYSAGRQDRVTQRFRRFAVCWRDVAGLSAEDTAKRIRADELDLLVDLSGHTQASCLPVLAYRPAPVQVSGIGYMNTTGLSAVDYFLSDVSCLPLDEPVRGFTEQVLRLPHSHLCYAPDLLREMPCAGEVAPCIHKGYVTFGCFNNFAKVSEQTLQLWRAILERLPEARLILKGKVCSVEAGRREVKKRLMNFGFCWDQIELRPYSPDYLEQYREIDIALDTMPYTGGLTTCEALYMGVPVITLRGRSHGARFSASILANAGLEQLVAEGEMDYVQKAVSLAEAPELIGKLHKGLRAQLQASPLMDQKLYMQELERIYKRIAGSVVQE